MKEKIEETNVVTNANTAEGTALGCSWVDIAHTLDFSDEEINFLSSFGSSLHSYSTRKAYLYNLVKICQYYNKTISNIAPAEWTEYINELVPKEMQKQGIRQAASRARLKYFAVLKFMRFLEANGRDTAYIQSALVCPAKAKAPNIDSYPTASDAAFILTEAKKSDPQVYIAVLLAYECVMQTGEILKMKNDDFYAVKNSDSESYYIKVPVMRGQKRRTIAIGKDVYDELCSMRRYSVSQGCVNLIVTGSTPISRWSLGDRLRSVCLKLIDAGSIKECFTISSIRGAAINRLLMSDGASAATAARYAGIHESYVYSIKQEAIGRAVELPGTRKGFTLDDMLKYGSRP